MNQTPKINLGNHRLHPRQENINDIRSQLEVSFQESTGILRIILEAFGYLGFLTALADPKMTAMIDDLKILIGLSIGFSADTVQSGSFDKTSDLAINSLKYTGEVLAIGRWFKLDFGYLIPNLLLSPFLATDAEEALDAKIARMQGVSKTDVARQLKEALEFVNEQRACTQEQLQAHRDTIGGIIPGAVFYKQAFGTYYQLALFAQVIKAIFQGEVEAAAEERHRAH